MGHYATHFYRFVPQSSIVGQLHQIADEIEALLLLILRKLFLVLKYYLILAYVLVLSSLETNPMKKILRGESDLISSDVQDIEKWRFSPLTVYLQPKLMYPVQIPLSNHPVD